MIHWARTGRLKAAGIEAGQAEANVEVMGQSVNQLVTVERFEAGIEMLQARIDVVHTELHARIDELYIRIDAACTELRAEIARSFLIAVGVMIAANALMLTIFGIVLKGKAGL